ncbi:hypothetical protein [Fulvivirga lutea]|uniref:YtxH domain-containing protein n=1 Tax=Fulvivirga lutea TaxID=2810512 RepID=A0A974WFW4_9BACT|nr:hypothetical protein [Fulvivirga lutea]QSE97754.1 hypothetical protein JR347_01300 [Fulvivirga lutea]
MKTGKKLALLFGLATGAAVAFMAFGKTGKKVRSSVVKKASELDNKGKTDLYDESDVNYT